MKRNTYIYRSRPTSPKRIRWKQIFLAVILILAVPKAACIFSSQPSDTLQTKSSFLNEYRATPTDLPETPGIEQASLNVGFDRHQEIIANQEVEDESNTILERIVRVARGDTLMGILLASGLARSEAHAAVSALREVYNPRELRPGHEVVLTFRSAGDDPEEELFEGLSMQVDVDKNVKVLREDAQTFSAMEEQWDLQVDQAAVQGEITSSLYAAALDSSLPSPVLIQLIRAYSFDVDFQRDIHPGDSFAALFERHVDDQGQAVREGPLLYANLVTSGRSLKIYRYTSPDGETDYFNEHGQSVRKTLMLTPVDGARLSSGYGMRRHPILGYSRMHKGLDFAAPTGTPIMAAGDGVVTQAGRKGNYGIAVQLRHPNEYGTLYAHMSRLARGIRGGTRVKQGEVIGYVGSTGMSTGPHLHYEVLHRGKHVNPASVNSPPGRTLAGQDLLQFKRIKEELEGHYAALTGKMLADISNQETSSRLD